MVAKSVVAPMDRIKILYQVTSEVRRRREREVGLLEVFSPKTKRDGEEFSASTTSLHCRPS